MACLLTLQHLTDYFSTEFPEDGEEAYLNLTCAWEEGYSDEVPAEVREAFEDWLSAPPGDEAGEAAVPLRKLLGIADE